MNDKLTELRNQLAELNTKIDNFEIDPDNYTDSYDEMLNDSYPNFMEQYEPARTLRMVDETAYRCGLLDYIDGFDLEDDNDYIKLVDERDSLELEIEELNNETEFEQIIGE
jgi:hypothetical protein